MQEFRSEFDAKIEKLREEMRRDFVTRFEFDPVKSLVYGFVGLALSSLILGILALVLRSK